MPAGRKCEVCECPERAAIDIALTTGTTPAARKLFPRYTTSQLHAHKSKHITLAAVKGIVSSAPKPPTYPKLPDSATPLERSAATCEWLRLQIDHAVAVNTAQKEMTQLIGQLTNANRHHARLSGALDITEAQIVRSAPWARIMVVLRDALKKHPKALAEVTEAIEDLADGER